MLTVAPNSGCQVAVVWFVALHWQAAHDSCAGSSATLKCLSCQAWQRVWHCVSGSGKPWPNLVAGVLLHRTRHITQRRGNKLPTRHNLWLQSNVLATVGRLTMEAVPGLPGTMAVRRFVTEQSEGDGRLHIICMASILAHIVAQRTARFRLPWNLRQARMLNAQCVWG